MRSPNDLVDHGTEGEYTYKHVCWDCGWTEEVTMTIERSSTERSGASVVVEDDESEE